MVRLAPGTRSSPYTAGGEPGVSSLRALTPRRMSMATSVSALRRMEMLSLARFGIARKLVSSRSTAGSFRIRHSRTAVPTVLTLGTRCASNGEAATTSRAQNRGTRIMRRRSRASGDLARLVGMPPTTIARVLETALYADDLTAADHFYGTVLGLERITFVEGRHVFFRCGQGVVLIFDRRSTANVPTSVKGATVPLHGASGAGHMALAIAEADVPAWRAYLEAHGIVIESEITWPRGGRSLYVRDPAGNSVELASPMLWGLPE